MRYKLTHVNGNNYSEISKEQFEKIEVAVHGILSVIDMEVMYDMIVDSYIEFETELMNMSMNWPVHRYGSMFSARMASNIINRRLVNIMTTGMMFKEYFRCGITSDPDIKELVEKIFCERYDNLGSYYSIMGMLRNYAQHTSLPISGCSIGLKCDVDESGNKTYGCSNIKPTIDMDIIKSSKRNNSLNKHDKDVLGRLTGSHSAKKLVRGYIDELSRIRSSIRKAVQLKLEYWEAECDSEIIRNLGPTACAVVEKDDGTSDEIGLCKDMIEVRKELERRNGRDTNLLYSYVSSQI